MHINVNGILAKIKKMMRFIQESQPDIVAIIETHLKKQDEIHIRGYDWVGCNHEWAQRGCRGVGLLIKKGINYKHIPYRGMLMESGRCTGIEISDTRIHAIYLPVNTEP